MKSVKYFKKLGLILFGNLCAAMAIVFFVVPAGFISGGVTGIALVAEEYLHLPLSYGIAILSVLLLGVSWLVLGKEFAAGSALSAVSFPVFVWVCEQVVAYVPYRLTTEEFAINLAGAILLLSFGIATVMRQGASTGGLDTIAMILYKKKGVSLAFSVTAFEIVSMATQVIYSTLEGILGGVLVTILFPTIMNRLIARGDARVQVMVYSRKFEEINHYIDTRLDRGSTLFRVQGGFSREDTFAVQTIVNNRELFELKEEILKIDPHAFLAVSEVSQVNGKGFTIEVEASGNASKRRKRRKRQAAAKTAAPDASSIGTPEP